MEEILVHLQYVLLRRCQVQLAGAVHMDNSRRCIAHRTVARAVECRLKAHMACIVVRAAVRTSRGPVVARRFHRAACLLVGRQARVLTTFCAEAAAGSRC